MTPRDRADAARELLKSEVFKNVLADTRNAIVQRLETTPMADHDLQHEGVITLQLLKRFETQLQRYVEDWEMEVKREEQRNWIERTTQTLGSVWRK